MLHEKKKKTHLVCYMNLIIIINKVEKNEGAIKTTKRCVCLWCNAKPKFRQKQNPEIF